MFGKKKTQEPVTPQELSKLNDKQTQDPTIRKYHANMDSKQLVGLKKRRRILRVAIAVGTFVLLILFLVSLLVTKWGDLVIDIDRPAVAKGLILSEDPKFKDKHVTLSAKQQRDVTNITYNWLPVDLDTSKNGEHNGENYVAYTFYCKNIGEEAVDYNATLDVTGIAKSADEAVRVMVYKNGKKAIFAKTQYEDRSKAETDATAFVENDDTPVVMKTRTENFKPDDVDKYTIVIWIEGKDKECIDDIRDGYVRMRMVMGIDDPDATQSPFGDFYKNGEYVTDPNNYNEGQGIGTDTKPQN